MPLLQDNVRGGGGSQENRRSLNVLTFDATQFADTEAGSNRANEDESWRWAGAAPPASPRSARSPRSLVPPACFPPAPSAAFGSYSELARPGSWSEEPAGGGVSDLVSSLKALAMPPAPTRPNTYQARLSCEVLVESQWPPEGAEAPRRERFAPRRASLCEYGGAARRGAAADSVPRWSGALPLRDLDDYCGGWSPKVFLGGLPWDIGEQALLHALRHYEPVRVEWPKREWQAAPRGFAYVVLGGEARVRELLAAARREGAAWFVRVAADARAKDVQVIPWAVADSDWVRGGEGAGAGSVRLEPARTVFVGALHGMLTARALAHIMDELFAGVTYVGIDTDKNKYPIGSGRVTFDNVRSYVRAVSAGHVEIRTDKFTKRIQVDPYLEDSMCSVCRLRQGSYFCREPVCFQYFCRACWAWRHAAEEHRPLMRSAKAAGRAPAPGRPASLDGSAASPNDGTPSPPAVGAPALADWY